LTRWLAEKHNVPFVQTAVGEANVADGILANNAIYGGEGSGGPIDPKVGLIRDSFVGMAQILELMAKSKKTVEQIVSSFPPMTMIKDKMTMSKDVLMESLKVLENGMGAKNISQLDGVRLDWDDQWILLRASNTEPIVRLIAEAPTAEQAIGLIKKAKGLLGL
jgi:phosphomannomutase